MKNTLLICLLVLSAAACRPQVALTLFNRSSAPIDSVLVEGNQRYWLGSVPVNDSKKFYITTAQANFHSFVPFTLFVYSPVLSISQQWQKTGFTDSLYFFDHSLNKVDKERQRPDSFLLWFMASEPLRIDSIFAAGTMIRRITELTPTSFEVVLNHAATDKQKIISLRADGKLLNYDLRNSHIHDWTRHYQTLYVSKDSIQNSSPADSQPFEYVVEFRWERKGPVQKIEFLSPQPVKVYETEEGKLTRAVFDYNILTAANRIEIRIAKKKHSVRLNDKWNRTWTYNMVQVFDKKLYVQ